MPRHHRSTGPRRSPTRRSAEPASRARQSARPAPQDSDALPSQDSSTQHMPANPLHASAQCENRCFVDFLSGLNPQQREAVETTEGPVLILAGAGSGKTRVITHRISHLISANHVPPTAVLAVTFTNKAAGEMRSRVASLLEEMNLERPPLISTFHSFCVRMLRRDGDGLAAIRPGFTKTFSIYDDEDQLSIIKAAYRRMGLDEKAMPYRATLSQISQAKSVKKTPQEMYSE